MLYLVEIENSFSGSKILNDIIRAREFYQFVLIGLEYMKDHETNVFLKEHVASDEWKIIVERYTTGKATRVSWLSIFSGETHFQ